MAEKDHPSAVQATPEGHSAPAQAPPEEHPERVQALLEGLNEPQREAVIHGEGPLLILAGAGSGKTRVLTHRVAFLIFTGQAHPSEILAITFTNKAAQEMRGRVERLLGAHTRGMWLMTFHAACARVLRAQGERLGYTSRFTIYDQADTRRMVKRCIEEVGVDPKRFAPAAVHSQISQAKNKLLAASDYGQAAGSQFEEVVAEVYGVYESELMRMNAMDFDDLLFRTVNLLELFEEVRTRYARAFKHVLVDEYQDTNHAQYRLLQLFMGSHPPGGRAKPRRGARVDIPGHRNLAVVGDDSQSIYSFRGADVSNILDFSDDFPDARVVKLEQNYRSTQTILSAANAVIANNRGGIAKRLWSERGQGSPVKVHGLEDEHAEARFVVGEIERLLDEDPTHPSRAEIAVFYRTNAMSRVIEDTLVRREIAYQVIGGTKFYERAEIKDAIAYLGWIANPYDVVSFQRVANSPRRGLGQTSLSRIVAHSASVGQSVWEVAAAAERIPGLGAAAIKALSRFMATMEDLAALVRDTSKGASGVPVGDLMDAVLARTGYVEALEAEAVGRGEKAFESQGRIENLQQLVEVAHEFDANSSAEGDTLELFLQELALKADGDSRRDDEGLITLMTLHNAKGLEYPIVFVAGCEDGVFPHQRALDEGGVEEERRLFYVAVTRAMRELYLTYARRRAVFGAPTYGISSRFLDEIPAELTEREDLPVPRPGGAQVGVAGLGGFGGGLGERGRLWGDSPTNGVPPARAGARTGPSNSQTTIPSFRLGEDVVHAAFGEGVVTGVEPGGIIVVRFAGDGSERKLMADYAPVSRRGEVDILLYRSAHAPTGRPVHARVGTGPHAVRSSIRIRFVSATIIDGKAIAARVRADVARDVAELIAAGGGAPGLATVLVGEDPASAVYVGGKQRACVEVGMNPYDERLPADASYDQVAGRLRALNDDPGVSGVLLQLPLPDHLHGPSLTGLIDPRKDVDGLTPVNAGLLSQGQPGLRPCTPLGVLDLLASVDAQLAGAEAVVVGRSNLFGKPMAQLLLEANATVTVCHSRTRDLHGVCARADVLIAAVGRPRLIERDFVKPGAIVIDVGMNRLSAEQADRSKLDTPFGAHGGSSDRPASGLVGDVDFETVREVASAITPVPGGVGPMTIAMLLRNTLQAARMQSDLPPRQASGEERASKSGPKGVGRG